MYKSISGGKQNGSARDQDVEKPRHRQRLLILSSRGVTYRYSLIARMESCQITDHHGDTDTFSPTCTRSSHTPARTLNSTPKPNSTS